MAAIMIDGFDKYGSESRLHTDAYMYGEWDSGGESCIISWPLSETGYAIWNVSLRKRLFTPYPRLIGGVRFYIINDGGGGEIMSFRDEAGGYTNLQCMIGIKDRQLMLARHGIDVFLDPEDVIAVSSGPPIIERQTRYLEWDISFGPTASYKVWLDGILKLDGTGNTVTTANNYANWIGLTGGFVVIDDFYLFDNTGTTNNAPLLNNPRVETTFPTSDVMDQWNFGTTTLGPPRGTYPLYLGVGGDTLHLNRYVPVISGTLTGIIVHSAYASEYPIYRPVVYADNAEEPGALLAAGPLMETNASTVEGTLVLPLGTSLPVTVGVPIWLGWMVDRDIRAVALGGSFYGIPTEIKTVYANVPFSGGAPNPAPPVTHWNPSGWTSWVAAGVLEGVTDNWYVVSKNPVQENRSYLTDIDVGTQDMYTFGPLSLRAETVFAVALKGTFRKTDLGVRSVSLHMKSGTVDSAGPSEAPVVDRFTWQDAFYPTDPNTGSAWTKANLNAALSGFKIDV